MGNWALGLLLVGGAIASWYAGRYMANERRKTVDEATEAVLASDVRYVSMDRRRAKAVVWAYESGLHWWEDNPWRARMVLQDLLDYTTELEELIDGMESDGS